MNRSQTERAIGLILESASRAALSGEPMTDEELLARVDEDPIEMCIRTEVETAEQQVPERAREKAD